MTTRKHKNPKNKKTNSIFRKTRSKKQKGSGPLFSKTKPKRKTRSKIQRGGAEDDDIALIIASRDGDIDRVAMLLENGADVNAKTDTGTTALFNAILYRRTEVVRILLENGADVHVKTMYGSTTLDMAIWYGDIEIVSMLLENGADVNAKGKYGSTALIKASENGHTEIVKLLKEYIQRHEDLINYRRLRIKALNPEERKMPNSVKKFLSLKNSQGPVNRVTEYLGGKGKTRKNKKKLGRKTKR